MCIYSSCPPRDQHRAVPRLRGTPRLFSAAQAFPAIRATGNRVCDRLQLPSRPASANQAPAAHCWKSPPDPTRFQAREDQAEAVRSTKLSNFHLREPCRTSHDAPRPCPDPKLLADPRAKTRSHRANPFRQFEFLRFHKESRNSQSDGPPRSHSQSAFLGRLRARIASSILFLQTRSVCRTNPRYARSEIS